MWDRLSLKDAAWLPSSLSSMGLPHRAADARAKTGPWISFKHSRVSDPVDSCFHKTPVQFPTAVDDVTSTCGRRTIALFMRRPRSLLELLRFSGNGGRRYDEHGR